MFSTPARVRASMAELVLDHVDKIYRPRRKASVHAVQKLDLEVASGEIVALLGSSGCGKTSTLRMIAGFEDVTRGSITLGGKPIHLLAPKDRGVAMAFEAYSLYPPLTIRENIGFALAAQKLPAAEMQARVKAIAEMLEIANILDKYPTSVSGGQQQRASLGRALVRQANLYLLDEPMGQLEPQLRAVLRGRIKHYLREHKCTTILVTHDQTEANALADRIAVMEGGILQQYATPAELKARPANLFTGTFIGEPPMNVFQARPLVEAARVGFTLADGQTLAYSSNEFSDGVRAAMSRLATIVVGVRPHGVRLGGGPLNAEIAACQWLGDQTHVAAKLGGINAVSVMLERIVQPAGTAIACAIAAADLHLFDPASGRAISHGRELA
jgi:multiple sugar transport system ATP-binding protein